jgi:hypothetical protein
MTEHTSADIHKMFVQAHAHPSEDIARTVLINAGVDPAALEKTISTATGLVAYDLQAPAKNLYPVNTPIRNTLPRIGGGAGTATNWRQVNAIIGSGYDASGWVPEGQRAGAMSYSTSTKAASFCTLGEEDAATYEAISAAQGFEDVSSSMSTRLLQKLMLKEELALLGGNTSLQLGTPAAPTVMASAVSGVTGALPAATYSVIVVALTLEGMKNASLSSGVATAKTITGQDGKTFTLNGGSSNKSVSGSIPLSLGQVLQASVTPINGALGYAWYVGPVGGETLQAITTINSIALSAPLSTGNQAATAITADCSTNATAFDGLLTWAFKSGGYQNTLATGTPGVGTTLTASGKGTVNEIDAMLEGMWDAYQVSPDVLYVNSRQLRDITTKALSSGTAPLLSIRQDADAPGYQLTAGGNIGWYFNPFTMDGGQRIPIRLHPNVPAGTILGWASNLPAQYMSNNVPYVASVKTRQDYYAIDWPITTRQRQRGVYAEEVLAVYAPFAMGIISNIAPG